MSDKTSLRFNEQSWEKALKALKEKINPFNYESWIEPIRYISFEGKNLTLSVPSQFYIDWINEHYIDFIRSIVSEMVSGKEVSVSFSIHEIQDTEIEKSSIDLPATKLQPVKKIQPPVLNERYKFENFVVGKSNEFCVASAKAVASKLGKRYNPLFIYGGVGLGKTHLLHAIAHAAIEKNKDLEILYLSSEKFVNDLIGALQRGSMAAFRRKYRSPNLLLVDDIQFIANKERTQEEFFHTFNTLFEQKKQIVISSDKFPKDISNLEERLKSRFAWGLIADIHPPELEIKIAIVRNIASKEGFKIDDEVANFLASIVKSNIRELEGILARVMAYASLTGRDIDLNMAKETLRGIYEDTNRSLSISAIQKAVSSYFKITPAEIKSKSRKKSVTIPRHIAIYLCREYTSNSLPEIGNEFGKRDHTTVIHAVGKIKTEIERNTSLYNDVSNIKRDLDL